MNVGNLTIEIAANVARLQADMNEAKRAVTSAAKEMEQAVGFLKTAFIGLVGVGSVLGFKSLIDGAIEGKARLYDLSLQTGISVEGLSSLGKVAKFSNTSLDSIAGASNKLSKALFTQNEDSLGAAAAIKALGLNFDEFKQLAPDEQMRTLALELDKFQDGSAKSAAAMLLFGKTGAELLPFMKELAEKNNLVGKETTESAKAAKDYEDKLIALQAASDAWKKQLATELLPSMTAVVEEILRVKEGGESLGSVFVGVVKTAFETVAVLGANVAFVFQGFGREIGGWAAQINALAHGDLKGFSAIRDMVKEDADRAGKELDAFEQRVLGLAAPKEKAAGLVKPKLDDSLTRATAKDVKAKALKEEADAYGPLLAQVREKLALEQAEYDAGQKLTEAQKFQIDIYEKVEKVFDKLSVSQMLTIDSYVQQRLEIEKLNKTREEERAWVEKIKKETDQLYEAERRNVEQTQATAAAAQRELEQLGMTHEQLQALSTARTRETAAALRQQAAALEGSRMYEDIGVLYRQQAEDLEKLAAAKDAIAAKEANERQDPYAGATRAVKKYLEDVKNAGTATEQAIGSAIGGLENTLTDFVSHGKADFGKLFDSIIADALRLKVIKPLLAEVFGGGGGGGGGSSDFGLLMQGIQAFAGFGGGGMTVDTGGMGTNLTGGGLPTSGGRASGGPVGASRAYMVGESGPELFMPATAGQIVPNAGGGGVAITYAPVIRIDSRSDAAAIRSQVDRSVAQGNRALVEQLRAQGALR